MQHPDASSGMASAAFDAERFKRLIDQPFVVAGVHRHPGEQLRGAPHPVLAATERQQDPDPLSSLSVFSAEDWGRWECTSSIRDVLVQWI
ncbi:hypothetical protein ACWEQV_25845 [Rhodococcus aetherivorans]